MVFLLRFLAQADDDTVDLDAAVAALESVADMAQQLTEDDRRRLRDRLARLADEEQDPGLARFAGDVPTMLGLGG